MINQASNSDYYHIVFYSKIENAFLLEEWIEIYAFIKKVCNQNQIELYEIGGINDHIHLLIHLPTNLDIHDTIQSLKDISSDFIIKTFNKPNEYVWKKGFGSFRLKQQHLSFVSTYIKKQEQHHRIGLLFPELEDINSDVL